MLEVVLLSGIIISAFLSLILLRKGEKSVAEWVLLFWIASTGYLTTSYLLVYNGNYLLYPNFTVSGFCLPLLAGPCMFLYIKYQTRPLFFQKRDLLHALPFVLCSLLFVRFYFMSPALQMEVLRNNGDTFATEGLIKVSAIYLSGVVYIVLSFVALYRYRKTLKNEFSNVDSINFNWLLMLNIGLLIIWIIVMLIQDDRYIFGAGAIYIICIGYFGITQVKLFTNKDRIYTQTIPEEPAEPTKEGSDAPVTEKMAIPSAEAELWSRVLVYLDKEKPHLNPELKLLDLAMAMQVHPMVVSRAINRVSNASFYDLINKLRVEEFIRRVNADNEGRYTMIAHAFDSGFNSKATFNRNFKAITGQSPSDYFKTQGSQKTNTGIK